MSDTFRPKYVEIAAVIPRARLDALHEARRRAGLSKLTDVQMVYIAFAAGAGAELQALALLAPEAA